MPEEAPTAKRPRLSKEHGDSSDEDTEKRELFSRLWQHWQAYLASTEDQEDPESTPDTDELTEMLDIGRKHRDKILIVAQPANPPSKEDDMSLVDFYVRTWTKPEDLTPVLLSVAAHVLADDAIASCLEQKNASQPQQELDSQHSNNNNDDNMTAPRAFLEQALTWFPANASTWSTLASWVRMTQVREQQALEIAKIYRHVAWQASILRRAARRILTHFDDTVNNKDDKETCPLLPTLIEALVLNQVIGVEFEEPEESDEEDDDVNETKPVEDDKGQWSVSAVERTSRFMAAMQLSMAGYHDEAAIELGYFKLSHRLHPNVWDKTKAVGKTDELLSITKDPVVFGAPVLPKNVHENLLEIFAPDAPFWVESGYSQRGYYSFFLDRLELGQKPKDFVQDVIEAFLLPLVEKNLPSDADHIVGYEWWAHTRPLAANLGHNLHFDTDEALLKNQGQVTHPLISSVLYLNGTKDSGPTIVLNQNSDASALHADKIWRNDPSPNSYFLFPGNLLHGVLPCGSSDSAGTSKEMLDVNHLPDFKKYLSRNSCSTVRGVTSHRTSFMVGFWTRRVPDKMKDPDRLDGPCSPIPPSSRTWVKQVQKGYPRKGYSRDADASKPLAVPQVSPAWQALPENEHICQEPLDIAKSLDHRFFVLNPSTCFRECLFQRQEEESDAEDEGDN